MQAENLPTIVGKYCTMNNNYNLPYFYLTDMILDDMIANKLLPGEKRFIVRNALLLKHVHQVGFAKINILFFRIE